MVTLPFDECKINTVFCDWDDTLAIHLHQWPYWYNRASYITASFTNDKAFYIKQDKCMPNVALHELLLCLNTHNYVLSHSNYNFLEDARWEFLKRYYPDIKFERIFLVGQRELKKRLIEEYMETYRLNYENVLLIEDRLDTIEECYGTCLTMYVPELYARYTSGRG